MTALPDLRAFGLEVSDHLGAGGSGDVYAGAQVGLRRRPVAIKIFKPHVIAADEVVAREIEATLRLRHPNLVPVFAGNTDAPPLFLVLERADPEPPSHPLPLREMVTVGIKLCSALAVAHDAGIVHSDIKPDNILWRPGPEPLLSDFGSARIEAITRHRHDIGFTPLWAPPWIPGRPADRAGDVWSLAASLIWLHWEWSPREIRWAAMSEDLRTVFRAAMPTAPEQSSLGNDPALAFGRSLQACQTGRGWEMTSFPVSTQTNWASRGADGGEANTVPAPPPDQPPAGHQDLVDDLIEPNDETTVVAATGGRRRRGRRRLAAAAAATLVCAGAIGAAVADLGPFSSPDDDSAAPPSDATERDEQRPSSSTAAEDPPDAPSPNGTDPAASDRGDEDATSASDPSADSPRSIEEPLDARLAFASDQRGDLDIYLLGNDGVVNALDREGDDYSPSLSPDGSQLVFESNVDGRRAIFLAPVDGSSQPQQLSPPDADAAEPVWSPDGTRIAWSTTELGSWDIAVHDLASATTTFVATGTSDDRSPSWAPSGDALVFRSDRTGNGDIYLLELPTQQLRQITTSAAIDANPAIDDDGTVAFERNVNNDWDVFTSDANRVENRITIRFGFDGSPAWDAGRLIYVERNGSESSVVIAADNGRRVLHTSSGVTTDLQIQP